MYMAFGKYRETHNGKICCVCVCVYNMKSAAISYSRDHFCIFTPVCLGLLSGIFKLKALKTQIEVSSVT